jgi:ATP-dependent RNA helicase DeaD
MTPKLFSELGLSPEMLKAIDKLGFEQASPIQAESIPVLLSGKDVVGQSQTGSGKTAAFAVPAIEKVDPSSRATQILILCPTRELAVQVSEEIHKLTLFKRGIHALPIYGGQSYERQLFGLKQGAHIVIGTPGRVMDHMRRATLRLDSIKMVILDEADVMLNMGFRDDIDLILQSTPKERQTVFFSATLPRPIQELIKKHARDPQSVKIEQKTMTVSTVEQVYYEVDRRYKIELLTRLIDIHDLKLGIIFCNTKRMVDDLVDHLNAQGYSADRLHGDMNQAQRDRVMNKFRKSGLEFLVATDVAARGIDVDDVEVVFNYDLPYDAEDYVHRIGRTGRAGRSGMAVSFAAGREVFQIRHIERFTNMRIQRGKPPTADEVEEARANVFLGKIRATLQSGEFKGQERFVERLLEEGFTSTDIAAAVLHQLQTGEATPAVRSTRDEEPSRSERPSARDRREDRFDRDAGPRERPSRYEDRPPRRDDRFERPERPPRRDFNAERPPSPVRTAKPLPAAPVKSSPAPAASDESAATETPGSAPAKASPAPEARAERPDRFEKPLRPARAFEKRERPERPEPWLEKKPRASRSTPGNQTRLYINVGSEMGVGPGDVVGAILGETGLPTGTVGIVDIRERHLFVDVAAEHASGIISKMNRAQIRGRRLKVKVA